MRLKLGVPESPEAQFVRSLRLRNWATGYPSLCGASGWPQPITALRARLRHALNPADQHQNTAVGYTLMVLNLSAVFQLCNWTMYLRFAVIDKTDENQLVSYILANKAYHFMVYGAIQLCLLYTSPSPRDS